MLWPCGADYTQSSGATAVVMVLVGESIVVANLGDSRCVIQRSATSPPPAQAGAAFATVDHKPSSVDETARIEAAGGTVVGNRVNGLLGVSRALGDFEMKDPAVSAHPCPMPMHCTAAAKARLRTALCCPTHTYARAHSPTHAQPPHIYGCHRCSRPHYPRYCTYSASPERIATPCICRPTLPTLPSALMSARVGWLSTGRQSSRAG